MHATTAYEWCEHSAPSVLCVKAGIFTSMWMGNPGVEFDGFSHGSGSEAGDSEDEDSGEVGTGVQACRYVSPLRQ